MIKCNEAKNIENFHQGANFFNGEISENEIDINAIYHFAECEKGKILEKSIQMRTSMYKDKTPYRHKFKYPDFPLSKNTIGKNKNIPLFSVYYDENGAEHRYNYLQSRYFYSHWYEKILKENKDLLYLKDLIEKGYNIQIVGYDGYPVIKDLWEHYLDISKPFGHELVLYSLLTVDKPENYPWNKYRNKYKEIYDQVIE